MHSPEMIVWGIIALICASGASCSWTRAQNQLPPAAFVGQPTIDDVVYAVHANSRRVQRLKTDGAHISADAGRLSAEINMEQPRNIRLRAQAFGLTGPELDLGSNNEEFWFWVKRQEPRALYFARHAEFALTPIKQVLPVEPEWLFEALGLVNFDAGGIHTGPYMKGPDRLEIHSRLPTPTGELAKVTIIDSRYGWILEQQVRDARGQLLATARASDHRFYPSEAVSMPHRIEISFPTQRQGFQIDVTRYILNQPVDSNSDIWIRPDIDGYPPVDIAAPQPTNQSPYLDPNAPITPPRTSLRSPTGHERIRGFR